MIFVIYLINLLILKVNFNMLENKMLHTFNFPKTERDITNGQSRNTGNTTHIRNNRRDTHYNQVW